VNKSVPGALLPEDFELSPTGILRLGPNVGSSARAEISLYKKVILAELAATLGKSAPHDIR
jgi:hypothetical protein